MFKLTDKILILILLIPGYVFADVDLKLCNKAPEKITAAVGYMRGDKWQAKGWYSIGSGRCIHPNIVTNNNNIYLRATSKSYTWEGRFEFCIDPKKRFHMLDRNQCSSSGKFFAIDAGNSQSYTQNFTCSNCASVSHIIGEWHDVTALVRKYTNLARKIHDACRKHCQGNRRKGTLQSISVSYNGNYKYSVRAFASLKNAHHTDGPLGIGGGIGWSHTINVESTGILDSRTCRLRINRIKVLNDNLGLSGLARGEEGKIHKINNCARLLTS